MNQLNIRLKSNIKNYHTFKDSINKNIMQDLNVCFLYIDKVKIRTNWNIWFE